MPYRTAVIVSYATVMLSGVVTRDAVIARTGTVPD
jgi:hypothetical protein